MAPSRKKKSTTSFHISWPYIPCACTVRLHQNNSDQSHRTTALTLYTTAPAASLEQSVGTSLSVPPESTDAMLSEQMDQSDMLADYYNSMDEDSEPTIGPKPRTQTKVMDEWLTHREAYLYEMLQHDGQEGL